MTTASPPAGWYDDPERDGQLRWWNGSGWTQDRVTPPVTPPAAVPPAEAAATVSAPPTAAAAPPVTPTLPGMDPESMTAATLPGSAPGAVARTEASAASWNAPPAPAATIDPGTAALAGPGERFLAAVIDGLVGLALYLLLLLVLGVAQLLPDVLAAMVVVIAVVTMYGLMFVSVVLGEGRLGQSYGKHIMRIKVVSTYTGRPIGSPAAFGRGLMRAFGLYALGLGVLWILWDRRRQGWHDKVVSSVVIEQADAERLDPLAYVRAIFAV